MSQGLFLTPQKPDFGGDPPPKGGQNTPLASKNGPFWKKHTISDEISGFFGHYIHAFYKKGLFLSHLRTENTIKMALKHNLLGHYIKGL